MRKFLEPFARPSRDKGSEQARKLRSNQLSYAPVFENLGIYEFKNLRI